MSAGKYKKHHHWGHRHEGGINKIESFQNFKYKGLKPSVNVCQSYKVLNDRNAGVGNERWKGAAKTSIAYV